MKSLHHGREERESERVDLIIMSKIMSGIQKLDRGDLTVRDYRSARGHDLKVR